VLIAHVLSSLALGGQERLVVDLARRQRPAARGILAVTLAGRSQGALPDELARAGVEVVAVSRREGVDPALPARLYRLFRQRRVDLVHTHNRMPLVYAAPAGKLAGARVVHTRHGPGVGTPRERWLRRQAARFADAYVTVSAETARVHHDCAPAKRSVIENGVDVTLFRPDPEARAAVRGALGIGPAAWVIGTVGRLAPEKDQALLLRAAAPLLAGERMLLLAGDGPERTRLQALAADLGVAARVRLLGARADVPRLLAALDVFALTSRMEGLPLALLEAMATALPVVATPVGAIPAVLGDQGERGFLATGEGELRGHLTALAAAPDRARALGAAGRARVVARFSLERMVERYWALYRGTSW
jgi:glycosyltransferase involved in cell wall biosynthesis